MVPVVLWLNQGVIIYMFPWDVLGLIARFYYPL